MTQAAPGEVLEFIRSGSKFIIAGHKEPDGDCIGSQLALCSVLRRMGKTAIPCSAGPFKRTEVMPYEKLFKPAPDENDKKEARLILVDCSQPGRSGDLEPHLKGLPAAIIDHHASGAGEQHAENTLIFSNPGAPSTTSMIYTIIKALGMELTGEEARLLLFGLCTDTGYFRHVDETGADVFTTTAELIRAGANPKQVYADIYGGKSMNSRILLGRTLARSQSFFDGRLIITHEEKEDIDELGIESRDSDILYQMLQSISGVQVIAYIRQETSQGNSGTNPECSIGLRSRDQFNVGRIAEALNGGGHKNAAGCTIPGDIRNAEKIILEMFQTLGV